MQIEIHVLDDARKVIHLALASEKFRSGKSRGSVVKWLLLWLLLLILSLIVIFVILVVDATIVTMQTVVCWRSCARGAFSNLNGLLDTDECVVAHRAYNVENASVNLFLAHNELLLCHCALVFVRLRLAIVCHLVVQSKVRIHNRFHCLFWSCQFLLIFIRLLNLIIPFDIGRGVSGWNIVVSSLKF